MFGESPLQKDGVVLALSNSNLVENQNQQYETGMVVEVEASEMGNRNDSLLLIEGGEDVIDCSPPENDPIVDNLCPMCLEERPHGLIQIPHRDDTLGDLSSHKMCFECIEQYRAASRIAAHVSASSSAARAEKEALFTCPFCMEEISSKNKRKLWDAMNAESSRRSFENLERFFNCHELLQCVLSFLPPGISMAKAIQINWRWYEAFHDMEPNADTVGTCMSHYAGTIRYWWAVKHEVRDNCDRILHLGRGYEEDLKREEKDCKFAIAKVYPSEYLDELERACADELRKVSVNLQVAVDQLHGASEQYPQLRRLTQPGSPVLPHPDCDTIAMCVVFVLSGVKRVNGVGHWSGMASLHAIAASSNIVTSATLYNYEQHGSADLAAALQPFCEGFEPDVAGLRRCNLSIFVAFWIWIKALYGVMQVFYTHPSFVLRNTVFRDLHRVQKEKQRLALAMGQLMKAPSASVAKQKQLLLQQLKVAVDTLKQDHESFLQNLIDVELESREQVEVIDQEAQERRRLERQYKQLVSDEKGKLTAYRRNAALASFKQLQY